MEYEIDLKWKISDSNTDWYRQFSLNSLGLVTRADCNKLWFIQEMAS